MFQSEELKRYEALEKEQIHVTLSNPLKTRAIAEARIKTDKIDARLLAHLLRANLVAESYVPDKQTRARRALLRHRASIVKTRTQIKNPIHNLLDKYNLKPTCTDLFGRKGVEWLLNLQLEPIDKTILTSDLQILDALDTQVQNINLEIASIAVGQENAKLLMTLPGVDYYAAMLLINEIDDINRFPTGDKLVSYAGLGPSQRQSADDTFHGHITRQGNRYIRWILIEAAQHASRFHPQLKPFDDRIAASQTRSPTSHRSRSAEASHLHLPSP